MNNKQPSKDINQPTDTMPPPEPTDSSPRNVPELSTKERKQVTERTAISAVVVHETIRAEGEQELSRPPAALAWSGLAAGLSMGFSLVTQGLLHTYLPTAFWTPLIGNIIGDVSLVAALNFAQVTTETGKNN